MKVASVQMDVRLGAVVENLADVEATLVEVAAGGAQLIVFPECTLTGYAFDSREETVSVAEPIPGPRTDAVARVCHRLGVHTVVGTLEAAGDDVFNACALIGPTGLVGKYRKVHLPFGGVDRFATPGDRTFGVWDVCGVHVGINVCYDCAFPESARVTALRGADLIVLPTAWPTGCGTVEEATFITQARAFENHIFYLTAARVGTERGVRYIGHSKICDPSGRILASADHADRAVLVAEIDPALARAKHIVDVPDKHEIHRFADRRPPLYAAIMDRAT